MSTNTNAPVLDHVQTASGKLTVTDQAIMLDQPGFPRRKTRSIFRSAVVGLDHRVTAKPNVLSKRGAVDVTLHLQGTETLLIRALSVQDATTFLALFGMAL